MYGVKNQRITNILDWMIRARVDSVKFDNDPSFMAFHIDYLTKEKIDGIQGYIFAFSHYYKHPSGDMIADPDMEIFYDPNTTEMYPISYQDFYGYKPAMIKEGNKWKINYALQKELSFFLHEWLNKVVQQQGILNPSYQYYYYRKI